MALIDARHIPNAITVFRIVLVVPIALLLWANEYRWALFMMVVAGFSDALDGALARRFHWTSAFGAAIDPVADKLLVGVLFVMFTIQGHLPLWVAAIAVGRDAIIMTGAGLYKWLFEKIEFRPTFISKANTAMQIITLSALLVALCDFEMLSVVVGRALDPWCFYVLAVLGISSGVDYVITWGRRAYARSRA